MSRGTDFLNEVTQKIRNSIQELNETILEVQKDIEGMHEYYWENYSEMDEYGYENFDNQQALLTQVNANTENHNRRIRLMKMMDSPFFGSVDFLYQDDEQPETFYIGIGNYAERTGSIPLIYDWRAPVSSLFYDYDKGPASYEAPAGVLYGDILSKWQYKIRRGKMQYEFESDMVIDDEILKQELGANSDVKLKSIVSTIQKEQNEIIRNTKDKIMVIQGVAGSGKTSVALHRIAYLLYHDRNQLKSSNVLILSPNSVFSDYISHILPELGEENIKEMSFDLFAHKQLQGTISDCQDRYDHIEQRMSFWSEEAEERWQWKQSEEFLQAMEVFLIDLEDRLVDFKDMKYKNLEVSAEELMKLFYTKYMDKPMFSRMEMLIDYFIDEYETLSQKDLEEDEAYLINKRFMGMYVTTDLYKIYNWFLEENGWPTLPDLPVEKRILNYEDVYPMLYLKYRLQTNNDHKLIKHLVIDEMQDYTYLQYRILAQMFSCSMTILGDRAQTIDEEPRDVLKFLPKIFGKDIRRIEINKSYRNTLEIAAYAGKYNDISGIEFLERHGKEVTEYSCSTSDEALEHILSNLNLGTDGYETAAILTMTEEEALLAYAYMKQKREDVSYIDRNSSHFKKGVTITTYYLAKGLEFDQVFVLGGKKESSFFNQYRYISATRALHELYVYDVEQK